MSKYFRYFIEFNIYLVLIFFIYLLLFNTADFLIDGDSNWILRTGEYIIENKKLPAGDILSWSNSGENIILYQWLFMVVTAGAKLYLPEYFFLKLFTLVYLMSFCILPLFLCYKQKISLVIPLVISCLIMASEMSLFSLRPQLFTCLFLGIQYVLVFLLKQKQVNIKILFLVLPVMYCLWGNIHTGVLLGLVLFAVQLIGDVLEKQKIKHYIYLIIICFVASLSNPYGLGIYEHLLHIAVGERELNNYIAELQKYNFSYLLLLVPFILLAVIRKLKQVISLQDLLICVVFTLMAFFSDRLILFAGLFYALVMPVVLGKLTNNKIPQRTGAVISVIFISVLVFSLNNNLTEASLIGRGKKYQPAIIEFVKLYKANPAKEINTGVLGSYLLGNKELKSLGYKSGLDTRYDFYDEYAFQIIKLFEQKDRNLEELKEYLQKNNIKYLLERTESSNLYKKIGDNPDFKLLYQDKHAYIFEYINKNI